jgi:two-component system cell cycle response regulator
MASAHDDDDDAGQTRIRPAPVDVGPEGRDRAYLIVLAGMSRGQMFKLDKSRAVIGRGGEVQIRLSDEGISREHAVIHLTSEGVMVEDLGSTNGTFCNGMRVTTRPLDDGDKIML